LENDNVFSSPRIEYIEKNFNFYLTNNVFYDYIINFCWHVIPPAVLTFLTIKYLPIIQKWAFKIYIENSFERKEMHWKRNSEYEKRRTERFEIMAEEKIKQKTQRKKIEKSQTQEEKWIEEYKNFEKSQLFYKFNQIIKSLYNHSGQISPFLSGGYHRIVYIDILALVHSKELINKEGLDTKEVIEPTEKENFLYLNT
jgi:hypothetical protein